MIMAVLIIAIPSLIGLILIARYAPPCIAEYETLAGLRCAATKPEFAEKLRSLKLTDREVNEIKYMIAAGKIGRTTPGLVEEASRSRVKSSLPQLEIRVEIHEIWIVELPDKKVHFEIPTGNASVRVK